MQSCDKIVIRALDIDEWDDAMSLAWRTFMKYDAQDYTQQGIESFKNFITDSILYKMFINRAYLAFGAFENGKIVGMITLRNENLISLLFVDSAYHKKGIGRALIHFLCDYIVSEEGINLVRVNSSPYAVEFYHKLGFKDTDTEKVSDGISYTPMELLITSENNTF